MAKIRYIREDLPRSKNTMHIRGHPLNPIEEILVTRLNEVIKEVNGDTKVPTAASIKLVKTKVEKMIKKISDDTGLTDSAEYNNL